MNLAELVRATFADDNSIADPVAARALLDRLRRMARHLEPAAEDHQVQEWASDTFLKLRDHRTGRIAEFIDAPNAAKRLKGWCRKVIENAQNSSYRRRERKKDLLSSAAPIDPQDDAHGGDRLEYSEPAGADAPLLVRELLDALHAVIARAAGALLPRYREDYERRWGDLMDLAFGEVSMEDLVARRSDGQTDRKAYNRVNRGLSRAREKLIEQVDRDLDDGVLSPDQHRSLRETIGSYLTLRPSDPA